MTQPARHSPDFAQDLARAREDSRWLWRQTLVALGRISDDDPEDAEPSAPLPLRLNGRYLAGGASEFDGVLVDISPAGLRLEGPWSVAYGTWCVANIVHLGIVEGFVIDAAPKAFVIGVLAPQTRLARLAQRLAWRLRRDLQPVEERRSSVRVEMQPAQAVLKTTDGREINCRVFDISEGGAALHIGAGSLYFWVDQPISLNDRPGRVLRYFPGGLVIKFDGPEQ